MHLVLYIPLKLIYAVYAVQISGIVEHAHACIFDALMHNPDTCCCASPQKQWRPHIIHVVAHMPDK